MSNDRPRAEAARLVQEENERLKEELAQWRAEFERYRAFVRTLYDLQTECASIKSEGELLTYLGHLVECALASTRAADGSLLMVDSDTDELVFMQVRGSISATLPGYRLKGDEGVSGWVVQHNTAQLVNDPYHDARFLPRVDDHFQFVTRNLVAAPIRGTKHMLGVIEVLNKLDQQEFTTQDVELVCVLASLAAPVIEQFEAATRN